MMKLLCTYDYGESVFKTWETLGYSVTYIPEQALHEGVELESYEVLICYSPFKQMAIERLKNLRYIILSSIGFDQVPDLLMQRPEVTIINNQGGYSPPMGEWIVMMLLMGFKRALRLVQYDNQRQWKLETDLLEMTNKNIVFLGTGTIAQEAAKRLQGFECNIIGINTSGNQVAHFTRCYSWEDLNPQLAQADALVCCLPLTDKTHHLLSRDFFNVLKDTCIFINISRGAVIDDLALQSALGEGRFSFVALDVFEEEPLCTSSPYWQFEQVLVTSHQSWVSEMRNLRRLEGIQAHLESIISGKPLKHIVNKERGY